MTNPINIQSVDIATLDEAFHLLEHFYREEGFDTPAEAMRSSLRTVLSSPDSAAFIARQAEKAVGVASVTTSVGVEYGRSAELEDLYVMPEARGCGVASALIEAVCTWCREKEVTAVLITVTQEGNARHNLLEYYQRRGFKNTRRVIMERKLHS